MIIVQFVGVSTNGSTNLLVQVGDSGGLESSTYASIGLYLDGATAQLIATSTSGFLVTGAMGPAEILHGQLILTLEDSTGNTWIGSSVLSDLDSTTNINTGSGSKSLSETLTQIGITTVGGDSFDAGSINISYL